MIAYIDETKRFTEADWAAIAKHYKMREMLMSDVRATIVYDFESASWVAVAEWDSRLEGHGTTPDEAVENLKFQCNKTALWPKEEK